MDAPETSTSDESRGRYWLRCLRPMFWWLGFVVLLFGQRQLQELSQNTRLTFSVLLDGQPLTFDVLTKVDGNLVMSGQHVAPGWHTITVSHPKADAYTTNLFVLGKCDLGNINLARNRGTLTITATPPVEMLRVGGPEFIRTFSNSPGMTSSVPTDEYFVEAKYANWNQSWRVNVTKQLSGVLPIVVPVGSVRIGCNRADTSFRLLSAADGQQVQSGSLPATAANLVAGDYRLVAEYHGDRQERTVRIVEAVTNDVRFEFHYGAALLESEPSGASVRTADGRDLGMTPLSVPEITPGRWEFTLRRQGFLPVVASLDIRVNETNQFRTNLVSEAYSNGMRNARQYLSGGNFEQAVQFAKQALEAVPDDADATAIVHEATARVYLRDAESLLRAGNYAAVSNELASATALLPDDARAGELQAELKKRVQDLTQREEQARLAREATERQERSARPQEAFQAVVRALVRNDGQQLIQHTLNATMTASETESALLKAFNGEDPRFTTTPVTMTVPDSFGFLGWQLVPGGARRCLVAGAQTGDKQTEVVFKVIEYRANQTLTVQSLLNVRQDTSFIPLDTFRNDLTATERQRMQDGTQMATDRIRRAVGQSPEGQTVPN